MISFSKDFQRGINFHQSLVSDVATIGLPAGASVRQVIHYLQCFSYGSFLKYDHGATENLKLYGSKRPPEYNLSNVRTNVQLMYGTQDFLASESVSLKQSNFKPMVHRLHKNYGYFRIQFIWLENCGMLGEYGKTKWNYSIILILWFNRTWKE